MIISYTAAVTITLIALRDRWKSVSGDMGMEFRIDKCEMLKMEREKSTMSRNWCRRRYGEEAKIEEANHEVYKYAGILEREISPLNT